MTKDEKFIYPLFEGFSSHPPTVGHFVKYLNLLTLGCTNKVWGRTSHFKIGIIVYEKGLIKCTTQCAPSRILLLYYGLVCRRLVSCGLFTCLRLTTLTELLLLCCKIFFYFLPFCYLKNGASPSNLQCPSYQIISRKRTGSSFPKYSTCLSRREINKGREEGIRIHV